MRLHLLAAFLTFALASPALAVDEACIDLPGAAAIVADPAIDFILMGEVHGTVELPAAFADLVCAAAREATRPILIGIEHDAAGQGALDAYLASNGGAAARGALLAAESWGVPGGRASQAVLAVVEQAQRLRMRGADVTIVAFDHVIPTPGTTEAREQAMAAHLVRAREAKPGALVVALTGLGHADKEGFTSATPPMLSMAGFLPGERTLSLDFVRTGGEGWGCRREDGEDDLTCGPGPLIRRDVEEARGVDRTARRGGFDGEVSTGGALTASPPARAY